MKSVVKSSLVFLFNETKPMHVLVKQEGLKKTDEETVTPQNYPIKKS